MNRELTITERWTKHKENAEALAAGGRRMNRELTITERWSEHKENAEAQAAKTRERAKRAHSELDGITDMATQKRQRQE